MNSASGWRRRQTRDVDLRAAGVDNDEQTVARRVREIADTATDEDDGIEFEADALTTSVIGEGDRYEKPICDRLLDDSRLTG